MSSASTLGIPVPPLGGTIDEMALRGFLTGDDAITAADLAATPQEAAFHAEGDVWTHTLMALEALEALPAWRALDEVGRAVTFAAVLLHDVGKPATTRTEIDGRLSSRGHSARGEVLVRRWLWRRGLPFGLREQVAALVRHHQVPFFGIDRGDADASRTAARLSLRLRHDWLALVAEADARGRRCADPGDQSRMLDNTALWVELCRERGCLSGPHAFATDHTRVVYLEANDPRARLPNVAAHDDTTSEVIVMSGLPASGKDHWLATHRPELPVVSLDALRMAAEVDPEDDQGAIAAAAKEEARAHLRTARSFAWNATNVSQRLRGGIVALARAYRARVHIVYCEAQPDELAARNRERAVPVPRTALERMLDRWTVPALDEAHTATYATSSDGGPLPWPPRPSSGGGF